MKKKILAKGEKIKKSEKIESIYNFLDENNYPYFVRNEMCFSDAQIAVISYGSESGTGVDKHLDADLDKIFD
jgi:hypothetical protein